MNTAATYSFTDCRCWSAMVQEPIRVVVPRDFMVLIEHSTLAVCEPLMTQYNCAIRCWAKGDWSRATYLMRKICKALEDMHITTHCTKHSYDYMVFCMSTGFHRVPKTAGYCQLLRAANWYWLCGALKAAEASATKAYDLLSLVVEGLQQRPSATWAVKATLKQKVHLLADTRKFIISLRKKNKEECKPIILTRNYENEELSFRIWPCVLHTTHMQKLFENKITYEDIIADGRAEAQSVQNSSVGN